MFEMTTRLTRGLLTVSNHKSRSQHMGRVGLEPTMFTARVCELQSHAIATMQPARKRWTGRELNSDPGCSVIRPCTLSKPFPGPKITYP